MPFTRSQAQKPPTRSSGSQDSPSAEQIMKQPAPEQVSHELAPTKADILAPKAAKPVAANEAREIGGTHEPVVIPPSGEEEKRDIKATTGQEAEMNKTASGAVVGIAVAADGEIGTIRGRKRNVESLRQPFKKSRRVRRKIRETEEESDVEDDSEDTTTERCLLPNDLLIEGGNKNAFRHRLLCGEEIVVNFLDVYHTSLERFINENIIHVACDMLLREYACSPEKGWVYMHETEIMSLLLRNQPLDGQSLSNSRMECILNSTVLLIPVYTYASKHWSLLVVTNLKSIFNAAMQVKVPKRGLFDKPYIREDQAKPLAIHFDSMKSSNHKSVVLKVRTLLEYGITASWERLNEGSKRKPMFGGFVRRSLRFTDGIVTQQNDSQHKLGDTDWFEVSKEQFNTQFEVLAKRTLQFIQSKLAPAVTNLPLMMFPVHAVVDEVCCTLFKCDLQNANYTLATFFKSQEGVADKARSNAKKIAQSRLFEDVYDAVAKEMATKKLNVRKKPKREVSLSESHCRTIARYIFHYPRGVRFASCLFYTRWNYPDSMLVCTGVNIMLGRNPKLFGEALSSSASRVPKSKRVHFQMAVFLDWRRSRARNWNTVARFRLQELLIHFTGISEVILRACCRQARYIEEGEGASGSDEVEEAPREVDLVSDDDEDLPWAFHRSISIEEGQDENGKIRCTVSPFDIDSALTSCLSAAERVANDSILDCLSDFETHCKRVLQLSDSKMKITEVKHLVTESSMATVPTTFIQKFRENLVDKIKTMWGHLLCDDFVQRSVEPTLARVITAVRSNFERNGKLFLGICSPADVLVSESVAKRSKRSGAPASTKNAKSDATNPTSNTVSGQPKAVEHVERIVRDVRSFCLGVDTTCVNKSETSPLNEFLSLLFYVLQGCRVHARNDSFHCGELAEKKWGTETSHCQKMLEEAWESFTAMVKKLRDEFQRAAASECEESFELHIARLKYDVVVRAASKIANLTDRDGRSSFSFYKSDVFCYQVPSSYRDRSPIKIGRQFPYHYNGQEDVAIWNGIVTDVSCSSLTSEEGGVSVSGQIATIGDFPIDAQDAPQLYRMNLSVRIHSDVELWDDAAQVIGLTNSFVGVRIYECVRIVFAFHDGRSGYVFPHPVKSNYTHSFLGVVSSPCKTTDRGTDQRNPKFVGPQYFKVVVIVHDDVRQVSGCPCSIQDVVARFNRPPDQHQTAYSGCYLMPLDDMSLHDDIWQYSGLGFTPDLPLPFKLAFSNPAGADSYHSEQQRMHYKAVKAVHCTERAEQLTFPSMESLRADNERLIRKASLHCDKSLNDEQLSAIQSVLSDWQTRESPNGTINLSMRSREIQKYLNELGTIPTVSLQWWGSRSCFIQGPPGTGKTRMLAALIAVVLEHLESDVRVLVACETNKALDDIFVAVLNLFRGTGAYHRVYNSLVRIGTSKLRVVRDREVGHLRERDRRDMVERAKAVFTTFGSAHRNELVSSRKPFSLILFEESCLVKESMALHALTVGLRLGHKRNTTDRNNVVFVCIGDPCQLHEEDYIALPVSRIVDAHFFDRVFGRDIVMRGHTRMMLRRQYRMNPALADFVSRKFYNGNLITETDGDLGWKDCTLLKGLREHTRFPVSNMMVVDTTLEEERARDTIGTGRSFYNMFEVKVIVRMLKAWCEDFDAKLLTKKVTIITTYSRQRDELLKHLHEENMYFSVFTVDELQGGENDIIIISLVRARPTRTRNLGMEGSSIGFVANEERINVALSRARQCCVVIGFAKHIAMNCRLWRDFFVECAEKANAKEDGTHGYYRARYVDFNRDLRLTPFTPSYMK